MLESEAEYMERRRSMAHALFMNWWGEEWEALNQNEQDLLVSDYIDAENEEEALGMCTYLRRIGEGNLASYARSLEAGK